MPNMNDLSIDEMDEEIEKTDREISLAEKQEILKQYQKKYGIVDGIKGMMKKDNTENPQAKSSGGSGVDWNAIKFKL